MFGLGRNLPALATKRDDTASRSSQNIVDYAATTNALEDQSELIVSPFES